MPQTYIYEGSKIRTLIYYLTKYSLYSQNNIILNDKKIINKNCLDIFTDNLTV